MQGLLLGHLLRVLTSGLLTRYSLIACDLASDSQVGFERGDAVLLHAEDGHHSSGNDPAEVGHATPPPTRS